MLNTIDRYVADKIRFCDTNEEYPSNEVFVVDDVYEELDELPTYSFPDREKAISEIETDMSHFCFDDWGNENATWTEIKKILRGKAE